MSKLGLAFRTFFRLLKDDAFARQVEEIDSERESPQAARPTPGPPVVEDARSPALTLLAALQREARFVDFVMESLDGYPDDQVAAAARDVHRDCARVIQRIFAPEPLSDSTHGAPAEGGPIQVPRGFDPARYHLTGNVVGEPPFEGTLRHPGWRAASCEMPTWSGEAEAASVVAPLEVEL